MTRPNFLFIGPDKTGSSWLFEILRRHPQCFVADCKDLYFFDRYYARGLDWYEGFFRDARPEALAVGELSHDYLFSPLAAERIARDLPGVRLLTSLRDPVERTFSHYLYLVRSGRTRAPFAEALERFPELIDNSLYHRHLKAYFDRFERDRIRVLYFDQLRQDPRAYGYQVFDFLGVDREPDLPFERKVREASRPRSFALARLTKQAAVAVRDLGFPRLVGAIKHSPLTRWLYAPYDAADRPRLDTKTRRLLGERFRDDIQALEGLLQVDLSRWGEPPGRGE